MSRSKKFSWSLFLRRAILNWRWWLILPYMLVVCVPVSLLIILGEWLSDNDSAFRAPIEWWMRHALAKHPRGAK